MSLLPHQAGQDGHWVSVLPHMMGQELHLTALMPTAWKNSVSAHGI